MANLRLKKSILEVVDNQLKANDPPCTKNTYDKLLDAGYSKSEAKDKIGAVVLTEICRKLYSFSLGFNLF